VNLLVQNSFSQIARHHFQHFQTSCLYINDILRHFTRLRIWWSIYLFMIHIFVLLLTSCFVKNRSRFANVQFANNPSRFTNVFGCSKYISLLSEGMSCLKGRPKWEVGDFDQVEDHSVLLLGNILAHALFLAACKSHMQTLHGSWLF